ncbi:guanine deaminase [Compostibacter hankyongensis]|uniref:Guanine deaminase n=2 Tax=Compostibacter hankyongensis TaxID=1007089 RepID=A0ABP8FQJ0_9BACT
MGKREAHFMQLAIDLALEGMQQGKGGPFGAIVVKGDEIIGRGANQVPATSDPTAHAEVVAIREACRKLGTFELSGCEIYTSCEPCPMCLGAIYWARPDRVYYAGTRADAAGAGFDDAFIYKEISLPLAERSIPMIPMMKEEALSVFAAWRQKADKQRY